MSSSETTLNGRLLLDVTDTASYWSGSPTGIQRTLINMARAGSLNPETFAIVALDKAKDVFRGVPLEEFEKIFELPRESKIVKRNQLYKSITTPLFSLVPYGLAKAFERNVGDDLFKAIGRRAPRSVGTEMPPLSSTDTLLILDSNWNQDGYLKRVAKLKASAKFRVAGFVHDIIPITWPHFVAAKATESFKKWIVQLTRVSDVLVTNSKYTSFELDSWLKEVRLYEKPSIPVRFGNEAWVWGNNLPEESIPPSVVEKMGNGLILWVGSLDERKNLGVVLQAFARICSEMRQPPLLVVVGRKARGARHLIDFVQKHPRVSKSAVWLDSAPDEVLEKLMEFASLFVQSSWAEGYGLPVDEALIRGIPTLAAKSTSLPEVGGSSCAYFDPANANELFELMLRYFTCEDYAADLKSRASQHPKKRWADTITEIQRCVSAQ